MTVSVVVSVAVSVVVSPPLSVVVSVVGASEEVSVVVSVPPLDVCVLSVTLGVVLTPPAGVHDIGNVVGQLGSVGA